MKLLLFTSSKCSHCPDAERVVKKVAPDYHDKGLYFSKLRIKTNEGKEMSFKYNIMGTPTILLLDDEGNEVKRIVGTPSEGNLRNLIEKSLGLKKSLFGKFFS